MAKPHSAADPVQLLRKSVLKTRERLSDPEVENRSRKILNHVLEQWSHRVPRESQTVALYHPMPKEVQVIGIQNALEKMGLKIAFPRIISDGILEFVEVTGQSNLKWLPNRYGILEPANGPIVPIPELDVIFVPGVVFSPAGDRIGMGKGYYDRALAKSSRGFRISVAFEFQLVEHIPARKWDQKVHWLVLEDSEITTPAAAWVDDSRPRS